MPPRFRRDFLIDRARRRCEYCHFPQQRLALGLHIDHVVAQQHGGSDEESNLAMACEHCNACKGPNIASIDPETNQHVWLFNPRTQNWADHFQVKDDQVRGLRPSGRATARLLDMNNPNNVLFRRLLRLLGEGVGA